jgi:hypothetical protein
MQSKAGSQLDKYNQNELLSTSGRFAQPRLIHQNSVEDWTPTATNPPSLSSQCVTHWFPSSQASRHFHAGAFHTVTMWAYAGPVFAHGTTGAKRTVAPPPLHINLQKKCEALQYCDSNEFIELTVGTSRVLMSKAATNNICSNKRKP